MPKQMTPEERRAYMREYRAKRKAVPETVQGTDPVRQEPVEDWVAAVETVQRPVLEGRMKRERTDRAWQNPYTDGLPDTGYLIQGLTQHQRDVILGKAFPARRGV